MGACFSSPAADKPPAAGGKSATSGSGGGARASASSKSKAPAVPDFGLADYWDVIKLLGTGALFWGGGGPLSRKKRAARASAAHGAVHVCNLLHHHLAHLSIDSH